MNKFRKLLLCSLCLIITIFSIGISSKVNATDIANISAEQEATKKILSQLEDFEYSSDQNLKNKYISIANEYFKKKKINMEGLNYSKSTLATQISTNYRVLTVNINKKDHHEFSNVSIFFNAKGKIDNFVEVYLKKSIKNTFQLTIYQNGEKISDQISDIEFITAAEYMKKFSGGISTKVNWDGFLKCMGIVGIPASLLGSACGVACAITAGAGCLACVAIALGINSGSVAGCLYAYWK